MKQAKLNIQHIKITDLKLADYNARVITEDEFSGLNESLSTFGLVENIVVNKDMTVVGGHQRIRALQKQGFESVDCHVVDLDKHQEKKLNVILNSHTISGKYDDIKLSEILEELKLDDDYADLRLDVLEPLDLSEEVAPEEGQDEVPELKQDSFVVKGDIFEITAQGCKYRIGCLDALSSDDMDKLSQGELADLAHNDPRYGMKKEKDGVANDNQNFDDLLQFNKDWVNLQFQYIKPNGSFYCWGIDEPLMDIYSEILKPLISTQKATFRNLITWNKGHGQGQLSDRFRMYPIADEKCLFVMCGVQGINNNADNYFPGWEPIRQYLYDSCETLGIKSKEFHEISEVASNGGGMYSHHISAKGSQWAFITEENYNKLREYAKSKQTDAFKKEYNEIKKEYNSTKAYFNNIHDNQNNVWHFDRTGKKEREGTGEHATPKPIALCERAIKSSCPEGGLVLDWFCGSGSTAIACIKTKRSCYTCDISEHYTQVSVRRCIDFMNKNEIEFDITLNGEPFDITKLD